MQKGLLKKLDLFLAICQPTSGTRMGTYRYDRDRIERITKDRNMAAHGYGPSDEIPNVELDLGYLFLTSSFLYKLIATKYDRRVHAGDDKWVKWEELGEPDIPVAGPESLMREFPYSEMREKEEWQWSP